MCPTTHRLVIRSNDDDAVWWQHGTDYWQTLFGDYEKKKCTQNLLFFSATSWKKLSKISSNRIFLSQMLFPFLNYGDQSVRQRLRNKRSTSVNYYWSANVYLQNFIPPFTISERSFYSALRQLINMISCPDCDVNIN
jgi:hypothetical protein